MIIGNRETRKPFDNHATLADNIDAYWAFEETTSTNGFADSVRGLLLRSQTSPIYVISVAGGFIDRGVSNTAFGNSLFTDSTSVSTSPKNNRLYSLSTDRTITFWAYPTGSGGYYMQCTGPLGPVFNVLYSSGQFGVKVYSTYLTTESGYENQTATTTEATDGVWQFITVQFLHSEKQARIRIDNGSWHTTTALTTDFYPSVTSAKTMFLSNGNLMDELGTWSRRLTDNELNSLYNNGSGLTY